MKIRKNEFQNKIDRLKAYEVYCYQAAYFLLENEVEAIRITQHTLQELFTDDHFFRQKETLQQQKVRQILIKNAIGVSQLGLLYKTIKKHCGKLN